MDTAGRCARSTIVSAYHHTRQRTLQGCRKVCRALAHKFVSLYGGYRTGEVFLLNSTVTDYDKFLESVRVFRQCYIIRAFLVHCQFLILKAHVRNNEFCAFRNVKGEVSVKVGYGSGGRTFYHYRRTDKALTVSIRDLTCYFFCRLALWLNGLLRSTCSSGSIAYRYLLARDFILKACLVAQFAEQAIDALALNSDINALGEAVFHFLVVNKDILAGLFDIAQHLFDCRAVRLEDIHSGRAILYQCRSSVAHCGKCQQSHHEKRPKVSLQMKFRCCFSHCE